MISCDYIKCCVNDNMTTRRSSQNIFVFLLNYYSSNWAVEVDNYYTTISVWTESFIVISTTLSYERERRRGRYEYQFKIESQNSFMIPLALFSFSGNFLSLCFLFFGLVLDFPFFPMQIFFHFLRFAKYLHGNLPFLIWYLISVVSITGFPSELNGFFILRICL